MEEPHITKCEYKEKTNRTFITISDKHENKHIILRVEGEVEAKKQKRYEPKHGILAQFSIKRIE